MAYKSNKKARAEYLENEAKNRRAYERRKEREAGSGGGGGVGKVVLFLIVAFVVVQYLNNHKANQSPRVTAVSHTTR